MYNRVVDDNIDDVALTHCTSHVNPSLNISVLAYSMQTVFSDIFRLPQNDFKGQPVKISLLVRTA